LRRWLRSKTSSMVVSACRSLGEIPVSTLSSNSTSLSSRAVPFRTQGGLPKYWSTASLIICCTLILRFKASFWSSARYSSVPRNPICTSSFPIRSTLAVFHRFVIIMSSLSLDDLSTYRYAGLVRRKATKPPNKPNTHKTTGDEERIKISIRVPEPLYTKVRLHLVTRKPKTNFNAFTVEAIAAKLSKEAA
jgi:hypothetical protein